MFEMSDYRSIYADLEADALWEQYKKVWKLAQETCPIVYSGSLPPGVGGGFATRDKVIFIGRKDGIPDGTSEPEFTRPSMMKFEMSIVVHELSHAYSDLEGGDKYQEYLKSLALWTYVDMDGTILNDNDRKLIYEEEVKVELRGSSLIRKIAPDAEDKYFDMMVGNLNAYNSLLWTGRWPDGRRQKWEGRPLKIPQIPKGMSEF